MMKRTLASKHLISMLIIVALLTGFSYAVQPGRLALTEGNIESVTIYNHSEGSFKAYKESARIQAVLQTLGQMRKVKAVEELYPEQARDDSSINFNFRINFIDGSIRSYFVVAWKKGTTAYVHPVNEGEGYAVDKALLASLIQEQ